MFHSEQVRTPSNTSSDSQRKSSNFKTRLQLPRTPVQTLMELVSPRTQVQFSAFSNKSSDAQKHKSWKRLSYFFMFQLGHTRTALLRVSTLGSKRVGRTRYSLFKVLSRRKFAAVWSGQVQSVKPSEDDTSLVCRWLSQDRFLGVGRLIMDPSAVLGRNRSPESQPKHNHSQH